MRTEDDNAGSLFDPWHKDLHQWVRYLLALYWLFAGYVAHEELLVQTPDLEGVAWAVAIAIMALFLTTYARSIVASRRLEQLRENPEEIV